MQQTQTHSYNTQWMLSTGIASVSKLSDEGLQRLHYVAVNWLEET